jgi:hypothetical protein
MRSFLLPFTETAGIATTVPCFRLSVECESAHPAALVFDSTCSAYAAAFFPDGTLAGIDSCRASGSLPSTGSVATAPT